MKKTFIQEVIVVEGKHDTMALKEVFDCETIETGGTSLREEVFQRVEEALSKTGVIVFTDPDTPGNQIRQRIKDRFPQVKEVFIPKEKAKTSKKVGVEHASQSDLLEALQHVVHTADLKSESILMKDLVEMGLTLDEQAHLAREFVGNRLHIGTGNAKTFLKRLNHFGIKKEEVQEIMNQWKKQYRRPLEQKKS